MQCHSFSLEVCSHDFSLPVLVWTIFTAAEKSKVHGVLLHTPAARDIKSYMETIKMLWMWSRQTAWIMWTSKPCSLRFVMHAGLFVPSSNNELGTAF
ncbi:hypothetical protein JZ751_027311 [Albula glossodonta]|uniref:Uncharacterized protein n=1 Tax=Albula glossodonta TaxID=121402 RepID=A0A8T2NDC2_9TELE|nr:hypothetical protein JZ751_027311 [Albula glossodonta]